MKDSLRTHIHIATHLLVIAIAIILGAWFAHFSNRAIETTVQEQVNAQKRELFELAEITDRNGANTSMDGVIEDCTRRSEYESLLVKLGSLSKKDLVSVQNLFESCGSFYSERKALMVFQLSDALKNLHEKNELLTSLNVEPIPQKDLEEWEKLVTLEKKRSSLLTDQTDIQAKIISALISGSTAHTVDVVSLVNDAQQIAELLTVHDHEIDTLRNSLKE